MPITLIGGGSRSGKSSFGLSYARERGSRLAFIATAQSLDGEMADRIRKHQADRGAEFTTYEEPLAIASLISSLDASFDAIVVDCLTLWVSNLLLSGNDHLEDAFEKLVGTSSRSQARIIFISNEVGCGIVPENALARRFRDEAGRLNQLAAAAATEVYWMAFGIPMQLKARGV